MRGEDDCRKTSKGKTVKKGGGNDNEINDCNDNDDDADG